MTRFTARVLLAGLLSIGCDSASATSQDQGENAQAAALAERLPPKIHKIQKELPAWLKKTGDKKALALMQELDKQIKAKQFVEAEKTADSILTLMGATAPNPSMAGEKQSKKSPASRPTDATIKRLTEKVERVTAGVQKWAASGHDPAEIIKTMQEGFQPLMQAGKITEAEALVDRVLKQLGMEVITPSAAPADEQSAEERVLTRIHKIQQELAAWIKKTGRKQESDSLMQKLKGQLADRDFAAAEKTADTILELMGLSLAPATPPERSATAKDSKNTADPFAAFFPHRLVFLASERIALTPEQRGALLARVNKTEPRLEELKTALERKSAALTALISKERADEAAVLAQLNQFLDAEREAKLLQAGLGIAIHNLLTSEQQARLRELARNPGAVAKLEEQFKNRITAKIERVTAGAQQWAESGRDPSPIAQAMEQKVRPLMDSGRVFEAETEIDRVLDELNKDSK